MVFTVDAIVWAVWRIFALSTSSIMLTPIEFVQQEFADITNLPPEVWLRKMQEYNAIKSAKVNIEHLLDLPPKIKRALRSAVYAVYFNDNSDYLNALYGVIHEITGISYEDMDDGDLIKCIFRLLNPD